MYNTLFIRIFSRGVATPGDPQHDFPEPELNRRALCYACQLVARSCTWVRNISLYDAQRECSDALVFEWVAWRL